MGLLENTLCWKCKRHEGTFIHAMWACPLVLPFWQEIIRTIQERLSVPVPESIISFVSRGTGRVCPTFLNQHLALTGFISAARVILIKWKSQVRPEYRDWVKIMTENASFELLIAKSFVNVMNILC